MNILEVKNLVKKYADFTAVNNISFTVKQGQCFGLLGPNGAGKTTTVEIMEGIKQASDGEVLFKGRKIGKWFSQYAGVQFQQTSLMDHISGRELLLLFSGFYQDSVSIDSLISTCKLHDFIDKDANKLSGGQKQRLLLALALINKPEILFLDEPTTGLDPQSRRHFWELINSLKAQGKTIILTTHYMEEAEKLCDEILIIDRGEILAQGTPAQLLKEHGDLVKIRFDKTMLLPSDLPYEEDTLGRRFILSNDIKPILEILMQHNDQLDSLQIGAANLEDVFIKLTGHSLRD